MNFKNTWPVPQSVQHVLFALKSELNMPFTLPRSLARKIESCFHTGNAVSFIKCVLFIIDVSIFLHIKYFPR